MVDFIKSFTEDIDTPVFLKAGKNVFKIRQELAEAGSSPSKAMLRGVKELIFFKIAYHVISHYLFKDFDQLRSERNWSVVSCNSSVTTLKDGYNMGRFNASGVTPKSKHRHRM